ncbi:MAG TPA: hypothetical protein VG759_21040 [Candidatus Angelobacter sp.]|nr:hypothetical protein [Candidatus Angelobacter sp.]
MKTMSLLRKLVFCGLLALAFSYAQADDSTALTDTSAGGGGGGGVAVTGTNICGALHMYYYSQKRSRFRN